MTRMEKSVFRWRQALLPVITIIVLVILKGLSTPMYSTATGRFPAMMIEVMASRTLLIFRAPAGYYEDLNRASRPDWGRIGGAKYLPDAFRIRRFRPNLTTVADSPRIISPTNRFGYTGPDWQLIKPPGTRRIAVFGDSITQGLGLSSDQTFVSLLASRLNADRVPNQQHFEFLNFAVPAYQFPGIMDVALQDAPQFQPDVYVLMLTELSVYRSWDNHLVYLTQTGVDPKYDFVRKIISESNARQTDDVTTLNAKFAPYRMSMIRQNILKMKDNAEQHHAQFLVVLVPGVEDADISRQRFAGIPELLSSMNITYIDLSDTFTGMLDRQSIRLSRVDTHPNPRGDEMIYEALYSKLRANPEAWSKLVGPTVRNDAQIARRK